ncbi:hypothetical protein CW304_24325 [Bacillus sp. UFRGS-B20]|nr:hypothetical protein CW304_24325 [Bacillus sp. UFRGS-B20]
MHSRNNQLLRVVVPSFKRFQMKSDIPKTSWPLMPLLVLCFQLNIEKNKRITKAHVYTGFSLKSFLLTSVCFGLHYLD